MEKFDRRRHQRFGCLAGRKFIAKYSNTERMLGEIKDFSRSGIAFSSNDSLNRDNQVKLDLEISGLKQKIPASIQIIWSKEDSGNYTYGARLVNISPEHKTDILDLLYQDWRKKLKVTSLAN